MKHLKQEEITFDEFCKEMTGNGYVELLELWDESNKNKPKKHLKKKFKPKVREHWRKDAVIKLKTLLRTTEYPKGSFTNEEKLINVEISKPWGTRTSTSFEHNKIGKDDLIKFIKKELYL